MIVLFQLQIYTNFESNSQLKSESHLLYPVVSAANIYKFRKQFTTGGGRVPINVSCFSCKYIQISKAIHNNGKDIVLKSEVVSAANIYKFRKQFTTITIWRCQCHELFQLQIYTNFESNSQQYLICHFFSVSCFSCKYIQISKAIHNAKMVYNTLSFVVSAANIYKFRKQFTTSALRQMCWMCCFSCKYIQISKAIHNQSWLWLMMKLVVSAANIYKFRKQFTTCKTHAVQQRRLFQLQIYTNFESNSQPSVGISPIVWRLFQLQIYTNFESNSQPYSLTTKYLNCCFSCKYIQISKAIHNSLNPFSF